MLAVPRERIREIQPIDRAPLLEHGLARRVEIHVAALDGALDQIGELAHVDLGQLVAEASLGPS